MIVRAILFNPDLADNFDYFNDSKDTLRWLWEQTPSDKRDLVIQRLKAGHLKWERLEQFLDANETHDPDWVINYYPCGCRIETDGSDNYSFHACSLHSSANDLLEACKQSLTLIEQLQGSLGLKCIESSGLSQLAYCDLVGNIREAIAKATTEHPAQPPDSAP